jgi:membrane-associated protein
MHHLFAHIFIDIKSLLEWLQPKKLIETGGLILILIAIFSETGLFFGFFFPGDSLLFTAGLFCGMTANGTGDIKFDVPILLLLFSVFAAAVLGNLVGFWFGRTVGNNLYKRKDSLFFKKKYLDMTHNFYERNGRMAIIAGRFLPIIRTFVPILAGIIKLDFKKFLIYNIVGAFLWVFAFILAGYFLGYRYGETISKYLEYVVVALIIITIIPVIRTYLKERKRHAAAEQSKVGVEE